MKNRLKKLRQLHKLSQSELARSLKVSRQAVNGFESGKFDPSLEMAFKIANLLNVAIEDVFVYEAKNTMQTLVRQVKNLFGFEFGFERFTEKAINCLNFARNEAVRRNSLQVEPEHLFIALLADPIANSASLLRASGVKQNVETNEHSFENLEKIKFTSGTKFILELALQIVRLQNKKLIGTEHLLWGLVRLTETDNRITNDLIEQNKVDMTILNERLRETI